MIGEDIDAIRESARSVLVLVSDICWATEPTDLLTAFAREGVSTEDVSVQRMQLSFGSAQRAILAMPSPAAEVVLRKRKLLVGLVSCRVRIYDKQIIRCYLGSQKK